MFFHVSFPVHPKAAAALPVFLLSWPATPRAMEPVRFSQTHI